MLSAAVAFALVASVTSAAGPGPTLVRQASSVGVSAPLREVAARAPAFVPPQRPAVWERVNERNPKTERHRPGRSADAALQLVAPATTAMPSPSVNFAGMSASNNTAIFGGSSPIPPDPNGDVGPGHYVQMVNTLVRIYSKTGTPLTPFFGISDLFASVGSPCAGTNDGDPIVLYDPLADRWLLSQLCIETTAGREHELVAISTTADPTGTYYVYDFILPNDKANDYPKFGVWPDAYYMTNNQFFGDTNAFAGGGAFAFDRAKMLVGDPSASYIYFDEADINPEVSGQLPADLDGVALPPAGAPNLFIDIRADEFGDPADALRIFEFHADFANPSASTFTPRTDVAARRVRPSRHRGPQRRRAAATGRPGRFPRLARRPDDAPHRLPDALGRRPVLRPELHGQRERRGPDRRPVEIPGRGSLGRAAAKRVHRRRHRQQSGDLRSGRGLGHDRPRRLDGLGGAGPRRQHRARLLGFVHDALSLDRVRRAAGRRPGRSARAGRGDAAGGRRLADELGRPLGGLQRDERRPGRRVHVLVHERVLRGVRGFELADPDRGLQVPVVHGRVPRDDPGHRDRLRLGARR